MLETVLEKLSKAKELIEEAKKLAGDHDIELYREVYYFGLEVEPLARERVYWNSSTERCQLDPDYMDYI